MAWFSFTDASEGTFVFRSVDRAVIDHARALLAGETTADPLIAGTIVKSPVPWNIGWSYHLDPDSLFFFEVSTEVGDSTMAYIEEHLDEVGGAFLPGSVWTPWSSRLLDELRGRRGDAGPDVLIGAGGADLLFGRAGDDELIGAAGDDHLIGAPGRDTARGGSGDDKISGGAGADWLRGGQGDDELYGGDGADTILASFGRDLLAGGAGPDRFRFGSAEAAGLGRDIIADFASGRDLIDLRAIDASLAPGDQPFVFLGETPFTGTAGELRYARGELAGDIDGDGGADFRIGLSAVDALTGMDFLL